MLSVSEIKNVKFSRAVGGYKAEDVDVLLDKIEADYATFERMVREYELKIETLNTEIAGFKNSQSSIQNVLVSAQSLADRIVAEAKGKSEDIIKQAQVNIESITTREKELSSAFALKAQEQKLALENDLKKMVEDAKKKADAITAAADEKVKNQQMLFDRLKIEISAFKADAISKYKDGIEVLSKLPDSVPSSPEYIAEVLSTSFEKVEEKPKKAEVTRPIVEATFEKEISSKTETVAEEKPLVDTADFEQETVIETNPLSEIASKLGTLIDEPIEIVSNSDDVSEKDGFVINDTLSEEEE